MLHTTPFHAGERAVQERLGVREQIEPWARQVVRRYLPDEHRMFYESLPFLVLAARDNAGRPWVTLLAGQPGFIDTPDARTLRLTTRPAIGDALSGALLRGAEIGMLGIEFASRRRNRVNGRITADEADSTVIAVDQSFGNCPQYIRPRDWLIAANEVGGEVSRSDRLGPETARWIEGADTFFIASGHRGEGEAECFGMDASHRGGPPGFVAVADHQTLVFPDYAGNNHFNTIGNLVVDPRVGLLFVDFESGSMLQLSGTAAIDWDSEAVAAVAGAKRLVTVTVERVVLLRSVLPIRWRTSGDAERSLRVAEKRAESADVTSFVLTARDGGELPDYEPGQHLPLEVTIPDLNERLLRTYSLSAAPDRRRYRLSIKREERGLVSRYLHDEVAPGDVLRARLPAGDFVLRPGGRPVVLVSAGVGITPMVSMLQALAAEADSRPVWFLHGARDGAHHPLAAEVRSLVAGQPRIHAHVSYSRPRPEDALARDYDRVGRLDADVIESLLPTLDADFYFCGPVGFMGALISELGARGVPEDQLMMESFGPQGS